MRVSPEENSDPQTARSTSARATGPRTPVSSPLNRAVAAPPVTRILAARLYDSYTRTIVEHKEIIVDDISGLILAVRDVDDLSDAGLSQPLQVKGVDIDLSSARLIDLRSHQLVLPGFVDTHVHFFLHPYDEVSWDDQVTKESLTERTVRAVVHARNTLAAGYTAVRDLGTEGAGDADVGLRQSISSPLELVPGPRYFIANRATVSTGSYGPKHDINPGEDGVDGNTGSLVADGIDGVRRAVRQQLGAGADWIKIYADYRQRSRVTSAPPIAMGNYPLFSPAELAIMVSTAHQAHTKVAAHVNMRRALAGFLRPVDGAGKQKSKSVGRKALILNSIEHGSELGIDSSESTNPLLSKLRVASSPTPHDPSTFVGPLSEEVQQTFATIATSNVYWSPTLATYEWHGGDAWDKAQFTFKRALRFNELVKKQRVLHELSCRRGAPPSDSDLSNTYFRYPLRFTTGGDTGVFAHGQNAREMVCMVNLGVTPLEVLAYATLEGWRCVRGVLEGCWDDELHVRGALEGDLDGFGAGDDGSDEGGRNAWKMRVKKEEMGEEKGVDMFLEAALMNWRLPSDDAIDQGRAKITRADLGDNAVPFGAIRPGFTADIIALGGDVGDLETGSFAKSVSADNVLFVMKGGRVYKENGSFLG